MKKAIVVLFLFLNFEKAYCQDDLIVRNQIDSILQKIAIEKVSEKRITLMLSIFVTKVESFPHLALYTSEKLDSLGRSKKDKILKAMALSFAGHGYRLSGNYIKGLEYHHKATALAEETGNATIIAMSKMLMAHLYKDREEYKIALQLYLAANKISPSATEAQTIIAWSNMNLSAVYLALNVLDSTIYYSRNTAPNKDSVRYYPVALENVAGAYSKMGKTDLASQYYHQAIKFAEKNRKTRVQQSVYLGFAEHFRDIDQTDSCIYYAKKALAALQNTEFEFLAAGPAKLLMSIYQKTNADSTLKYLKIYTAANDSIFNTKANQQLQMMTFEEDQRRRDAIIEKTAYQNKIKSNLLFAVLGVSSFIAIILFRNNRQKQKTNKELQQTLIDLNSTQTQLIQSEKMASLGELTAGIAHEIQNPLNFVNNFSEINKELLVELKEEVEKGNLDEVKNLANDVIENSEKINHHGKRADGIVKGMLQHSRSSSGTKEPTDINTLADEYLRLAFHGLRAKDKSFNATLKTDYDESIGNVNVIPQDIGRVVLNLITNAFYVVSERKQQGIEGYDPTVTVKTKRAGDQVEISVIDNGNGIPKNVLDKIFQPFFTTKPTGQGTGLGLSMSYDIVTKGHAGNLSVETKEGEGTTFTITLPV